MPSHVTAPAARGSFAVRLPDDKTSSGSPAHSWPDAKRSDLYRLRVEEGLSYRAIGALYGVSRVTVGDQCHAFGIVTDREESLARWARVTREELADLYHRGRLSHLEIAARYGVSKPLVTKTLQAMDLAGGKGGKRGRLAWSRVTAADLTRLYWDESLTPREIGARFGVSRAAAELKLVTFGVPRRGVGGAGRVKDARWHTLTDLEITRLYHEEDLSQAALARRYGVGTETVRLRLRAIGCPMKQPQYHTVKPAWFRHENPRKETMHALHRALYRRWQAKAARSSGCGGQG